MKSLTRASFVAIGVALSSAAPGLGQTATAPSTWPAWYTGGEALPPGVHAIEKDSSYAVAGSTAGDLQADMDTRAPVVDGRRVQGAHFWEWWHHYEYSPVEDGNCEVTESVVLVRSLIVLPRWTDQALADQDLGRAWNGYRFRLREHEDGHRDITLTSASELWNRVGARSPTPCSSLRADIRALADSIFGASTTAQAAYDVETDHGLRQGARWPPGDA